MVIVIREAVPEGHCYNYGETWAKPRSSKLFLTCLNKTLSTKKSNFIFIL